MKRQGGFTLVELMIVVAIISIIAAVSIPALQEHKKKQAGGSIEQEAKQLLNKGIEGTAKVSAQLQVQTQQEKEKLQAKDTMRPGTVPVDFTCDDYTAFATSCIASMQVHGTVFRFKASCVQGVAGYDCQF